MRRSAQSGLGRDVQERPARLWGIFLGPRLRSKWKRWRWEARWKRLAHRQRLRGHGVPREVVDAIEDGWLPKGAPALDIGCGEGEIAAWLASQGCPAAGVDIARSALALARVRFPESPGHLEFHAIDVCRKAPPRP